MPDEPIIYDQLEEAYIPGLQNRQVNSARAARKLGRADANMTNPQGGRTVTYNGPVSNNNASRMNKRVQKAYNNAYGRQYNRNAAYTAAVAQDLADIEAMRRGGDEAVAAEQNYQTRHTNEAADKTAMALSVLPGTGIFGMVPIMHGIQQQRAAGVTDPLHTAMQVGMATIGMLPALQYVGGRGAAWADMLGGSGRKVSPYVGKWTTPPAGTGYNQGYEYFLHPKDYVIDARGNYHTPSTQTIDLRVRRFNTPEELNAARALSRRSYDARKAMYYDLFGEGSKTNSPFIDIIDRGPRDFRTGELGGSVMYNGEPVFDNVFDAMDFYKPRDVSILNAYDYWPKVNIRTLGTGLTFDPQIKVTK